MHIHAGSIAYAQAKINTGKGRHITNCTGCILLHMTIIYIMVHWKSRVVSAGYVLEKALVFTSIRSYY